MKKIVEVEYVGIEDVQEIMDDVLACIRKGHYVDIKLSENCGSPFVQVYVMVGGFEVTHSFDYVCEFRLTDCCKDVALMNQCKEYLRNLLNVEE